MVPSGECQPLNLGSMISLDIPTTGRLRQDTFLGTAESVAMQGRQVTLASSLPTAVAQPALRKGSEGSLFEASAKVHRWPSAMQAAWDTVQGPSGTSAHCSASLYCHSCCESGDHSVGPTELGFSRC